MRFTIILILLLFSFFGFSQEEKNSIYFPQEMLVHPDCENVTDKGSCLKNTIQKELSQIISEGINQFGTEQDTIKASISLDVDKNGILRENSGSPFIQDTTLSKKLSAALEGFDKRLPSFRILNKKPDDFYVTHRIFFQFLVKKNQDSLILAPIFKEFNAYKGGDITEVPVFPGCDEPIDKNMRLCFNKKMQTHIAQNFHYPRKAQKKKLQGKVYIMFEVDSKGSIEKIRTRGPHELLESEAIRIIQLLPNMKPGKKNGKPIRTPFAIPITFKLR